MKKKNLIVWDDDNHAQKIFFNGHFVGTTADIGNMINNVLIFYINEYIDEFKLSKLKCTEVHAWADFDDVDEDVYDNIFDFFDYADELSERQIELIENKDWEGLNKII